MKYFIKISAIVILFVLTISCERYDKKKNYFINKITRGNFEEVTKQVTRLLEESGFSVVTELDLHTRIMNNQDDVVMKPYRILGTCNASIAYQNILEEENIGVFIPCKVLIKEIDFNTIEVVFINPNAFMEEFNNDQLATSAKDVTDIFKSVLEVL
ncbi:DUF302 domain-containing protein [Carboxylicivirga sediminis]|uniref:DUF302 domain-containing protein n=1 Tax=Carboxylicivirga sediminis TaxID=2006564 RepID=A0A941IZI8_9BACT|nr:DUF302 domain-containing protein [Carboxylicivirga sediminis]MBR8536712.1 DUF302 domain-containing protein [Carboxylicivirga sediminis]